MAKLKSLEDLYYAELKDLYSAEKQITKALPAMIKGASSEELKNALQNHLEETENQIERLEQISANIGITLSGKKCKAMEGLLEEGKEILKEEGDAYVIDAAIISAAQKVEHYEIAGYGCAKTYARLLEDNDSMKLLEVTIEEEGNADKTLTEIAESINIDAIN